MKALLAPRRLISLVIAAVLVALAVAFFISREPDDRNVTAYFTEAVGLYKGNDVRIRGVNVGTVASVKQQGDRVKVVLAVNKKQPLPADVQAIIVAPTLVTGRFVQLTPQYAGGATLASGTAIPMTRTSVPVEWDQVLTQLDRLSTALGPNGANAQGALSDLIKTGADNLNGQGDNLHATIDRLSAAMTTLSDGRGDLFATVRNLSTFVDTLQASDTQVHDFNVQLSQVGTMLADNRTQLGQLFTALDSSVDSIKTFVADNRDQLTSTLGSLRTAATTLANQRQHIADLLQIAPSALSNLQNIYDPVSGSLTGVIAPTNGNTPATSFCSLLTNANLTGAQCETLLGGLIGGTGSTPLLSSLIPTISPFERNGGCNQVTAVPGPATTDVHTVTCAAGAGTGTSSGAPLIGSLLSTLLPGSSTSILSTLTGVLNSPGGASTLGALLNPVTGK